MALAIEVDREKIAEFCRQNRIRKLAFFGSALGDDFTTESDVDVLVEFEPDARIGLIRMGGMAVKLASILGREVDLRTPQDLSRYFRQEVVEGAEVLYVQG